MLYRYAVFLMLYQERADINDRIGADNGIRTWFLERKKRAARSGVL
jgi:hypothetical protein